MTEKLTDYHTLTLHYATYTDQTHGWEVRYSIHDSLLGTDTHKVLVFDRRCDDENLTPVQIMARLVAQFQPKLCPKEA